MAADGTDVRQMTSNSTVDDFPAWSQDSTQVAWTRAGNIWVMGADATSPHQVTNAPAGTVAEKPTWTPDGKIVYVRTPSGGKGALWRVGADGTGDALFEAGSPFGFGTYDPAVGRDGTRYATRGYDNLGGAHVWETPSGGGAAYEVSYGLVDEAADVSPDGQLVTYSRTNLNYSQPYDIYVTASGPGPEGGVAVGASPANDMQSAFAPDSAALAFSSDRDGDLEIWKIGIEGAGLIQLTSNSASETNPAWGSPTVLPPGGTSVPGPPTVTSSTPTGGAISVAFTANGTGGSPITSYLAHVCPHHERHLQDQVGDGQPVAGDGI